MVWMPFSYPLEQREYPNQVRVVVMSATDGLTREMEVMDTGAPCSSR